MVRMSWIQEELVLGCIFTLPVAQVACPSRETDFFWGDKHTCSAQVGHLDIPNLCISEV